VENFNDPTRRDAIARGLSARMLDERLDIEALLVLDAIVAQLVDSKPPRDHYNEDEGDEQAQAYRRGWNHGYRHREAMERVTRALRELAGAEAMDLRVRDALVGGG
jgi:hypothetical protein